MGSIPLIISDLKYSRSKLQKAIEGLSKRELAEIKIYESWTIKDVLAHIIGWDQRTLHTIPLMLQNRAGEIQGVEVEEHNRASVAAWRDKPLADVLAGLESTYRQLLEMIARIDHIEIDRRRDRNGRIITIRSYVIDVMAEHDRQHAAEIEAWRQQLDRSIEPEAIIATLAQNRADFGAALSGLSEVEIQAKSPGGGWSIQEVVGHIADWEEVIFKTARHLHDPSCPPVSLEGSSIDDWNELMVGRRAGQPWPDTIQALRDVQARLAEFISHLKPGDWRLRGAYPWNDQGTLAELILTAAEHYLEHLPEVKR